MLIVGGEFPKQKSQQRFISRTTERDKRKRLNTLNMKYTQIDEHKTHTHSKVPANRRNKSNLK